MPFEAVRARRAGAVTGAGGFTLNELLIVVMIAGILATSMLLVSTRQREAGMRRIARSALRLIYQAEKLYLSENAAYYPCAAAPCGPADWQLLGMGDPLVSGVPVDYRVTTAAGPSFTATATNTDNTALTMTIDQDGALDDSSWPL